MQQMVYTIRLDLRDTGIVNTSLRLKQGDSGIKIVVNVFNGGVAVFDSSTTPKIVFRRPDGAAVMADMTVESSSYSYTLVGNELQVPGKELIDVKFPLGDTGRESTLSCSIEVVPDTITPNTHGSDIYDNDLAELVAEATAAAETVEEVVGDSEAWAVGERNGVPVGPEDPAYHNNSKWWSEQANVTSLAALTDVDLDTLEDGNLLQLDGASGKWKNSSDVWATMAQNGAHNLLPNNAVTETKNGITATVNSSTGKITLSGTISEGQTYALFYISSYSSNGDLPIDDGSYILTGRPQTYTGTASLTLRFYNPNGDQANHDDTGNGVAVNYVKGSQYNVGIIVGGGAGKTINATIEPMLRKAEDANTIYTPYALTNRQLTEVTNVTLSPATGATVGSFAGYKIGKIVIISFIVNVASATTGAWINLGTLSIKPLFGATGGGVLVNCAGFAEINANTNGILQARVSTGGSIGIRAQMVFITA